jgi:Zn-dependent peptidase ImmA (M78 family)
MPGTANQKYSEAEERGVKLDVFEGSSCNFKSSELVECLLQETGQHETGAVCWQNILEFLKLDYVKFDFESSLKSQQTATKQVPRALLSFNERAIAVDEKVCDPRERFSIFHEISHYILPNHQDALYLCDETCMNFHTRSSLEKEANLVAADLLFKGNEFTTEANSQPLSAKMVKNLAQKYEASFEATARRLVEKHSHPAMLVVFQKHVINLQDGQKADQVWNVKYCIPSSSFKIDYFTKIRGSISPDISNQLICSSNDISDAIIRPLSVQTTDKKEHHQFQAEYFHNTYSIFCFLKPAT